MIKPKERPYIFYELTNSLCPICLKKVEAKVIFQDNNVYLLKNCLEHGVQKVLISTDIEYYKKSRSFLKAGQIPERFNTLTERGCPYDCGLCPDHEQHSCLTLLEITENCNLECPICYADSSPTAGRHRTLAEIEFMLDELVKNEGQPDIVQLSGGEPTIHPQFFEILDLVKTKPIRHLMINTNGIKIAKDRDFVQKLNTYKPSLEIYLQFDSLKENPLKELRGQDLRQIREKAIEHLNEVNLSTTLVVTVKKGLNDNEIGSIIDYALKQKCVRGVSFQPIQVAGRTENFNPETDRLTLGEVRQQIIKQNTVFGAEDIIPVPCHPDCIAMAYALKLNDKVIPLTGILNTETLINEGKNTIVYEHDEQLKAKVFELFSLNQTPHSSSDKIAELMCCLPELKVPESLNYENIFRIIIMEFLDPYNFDVRSVKRSCVHIIHPDGRIIPFDTYNIFYRNNKIDVKELGKR